jgi:RsiW-degrading membrane proteinase PrsW (M82 family)
MPPYTQLNFENFLFMILVGVGLAIVIILARGSEYLSFSFRGTSRAEDEQVHEFGGEVKESNRPVSWLIWLLFVGYFIWAASYILFVGARGI